MPTKQPTTSRPGEDNFMRYKKNFHNKTIFIAIALVIVVTIVAMTGVYYEYW
ncbi:hypothetical protein MKO06_10700 [Gramella sp. GC03-9]|uniref:Uncharacterized protein n=1 Tax=Christiangramia oceanisediminis TaxID=2920386 RepID=A0A9X2RCV5_9FLAO|nr:hypothetical protein [Gramella oceanisediminis]MCP9200381.1 hypothetical protein [Gramella oceanisediminis]